MYINKIKSVGYGLGNEIIENTSDLSFVLLGRNVEGVPFQQREDLWKISSKIFAYCIGGPWQVGQE